MSGYLEGGASGKFGDLMTRHLDPSFYTGQQGAARIGDVTRATCLAGKAPCVWLVVRGVGWPTWRGDRMPCHLEPSYYTGQQGAARIGDVSRATRLAGGWEILS